MALVKMRWARIGLNGVKLKPWSCERLSAMFTTGPWLVFRISVKKAMSLPLGVTSMMLLMVWLSAPGS